MAKYNYDKSILKGLGVGDFLNEVKVREQHLASGENTIPTSIYNPNIVSSQLHPTVQFGVIKEVIEHKDAKTFVISANKEKGTEQLAYFRAGQYISVILEFDGKFMCRPYAICSNPKDALKKNTYEITVKGISNGYGSKYILDNWQVGTEITMSGPLGDFYYERLRESKNVVALAGGAGITPFLSMARAIADKTEDFNFTILYGSRTAEDILLKKELEECVEKANGKVKVINVLSDEEKPNYEHGFISADIIKKYAPEDYSIFVCGPRAMYTFVEGEIAKLNLPRRKVRFELAGEYGDPTNDKEYPKDKAKQEYKVRVNYRGEHKDITCKSEQTLLQAIEEAGIKVTSDCRSGQCGWCHSRLISGEVYIPASSDGRRLADKKFGWIHPCATYPLSDIEMEVFPISL